MDILQIIESGQLHTICLLTRDEMNSLRKHTAIVKCVDQELTPLLTHRFMKKHGRRRVRCKRPTSMKSLSRQSVVLGNRKKDTRVGSNLGEQMESCKETPT